MVLILNTDSWWSAVLSIVLLVLLASIPVVGCLVVNRIADRRPSLGRWEKGPRHVGLVIARVAVGLLGVGVLTFVTGVSGRTCS